MNLAGLVELLSGGERLPGCELAHSDAVALVGFYFPGRAYCLVADWTVVDIAVSPRQLKAVVRRGVTPTLVNALCVIHDSKGRFPRGHWVRTSLGFRSPMIACSRQKTPFMC